MSIPTVKAMLIIQVIIFANDLNRSAPKSELFTHRAKIDMACLGVRVEENLSTCSNFVVENLRSRQRLSDRRI